MVEKRTNFLGPGKTQEQQQREEQEKRNNIKLIWTLCDVAIL